MGGEDLTAEGAERQLRALKERLAEADARCASLLAEKRRLAQDLHQARKRDAMAELTMCVIHSFNDSLAAILANTRWLLEETPLGDPHRLELETIDEAAGRAASLTKRLAEYARPRPTRCEPVDVNEVVASVETMLSRLVGNHLRIRVALAPALPSVCGVRRELEDFLVGCVLDARRATQSPGVVTITTEHSQRHVVLTIHDEGEPRETSSAPILDELLRGGATLDVESGRAGNVVRLTLPERFSKCTSSLVQVEERRRTILLVEDQDTLRALMGRALRRGGYHVLAAANLEEVTRLLDASTMGIDLLVTDWTLPGATGLDVLVAIRERRGDIGVLFMSGTDVPVAGFPLLLKPFGGQELLAKLRELLPPMTSGSSRPRS